MEIRIIPAIIAKSKEEADEKINRVKAHAGHIQLDIMDSKFVDNSSLNFDFSLPESESNAFEAHLMLAQPLAWIKQNREKRIETIIFHFEACENLRHAKKIIDEIKNQEKKAGIAIKPETKADEILPLIDEFDIVLVLTVDPGFYGGRFIPEVLEKVERIRKEKPEMNVEVDGGINDKTIAKAYSAGANFFVSGSFIVNSENPEDAIRKLKEAIGLR